MIDLNLIIVNNWFLIVVLYINVRMINFNKFFVLLMVDGERCDGMGYVNFLEGIGVLIWIGDFGVGGVLIIVCFESVLIEGWWVGVFVGVGDFVVLGVVLVGLGVIVLFLSYGVMW